MIEEKCFRIPAWSDLDSTTDELDAAFAEGWRYVAHLAVDRGIIVVTARERPVAAASKRKTKR